MWSRPKACGSQQHVFAALIVALLYVAHLHYCLASVQSDAIELLNGRVESATVRGKNWRSSKDLTCRTLNVDVGSVRIDMSGLLQQQLNFIEPAKGTGLMGFNAADFENLLMHPLITAVPVQPSNELFKFVRGDCSIDDSARCVQFAGSWRGARARVKLQQRGRSGPLEAVVTSDAASTSSSSTGAAISSADAAQIGSDIARYFQNLTLDLDGVLMTYSGMEFGRHTREDAVVKLLLQVQVKKVPDFLNPKF
jgi:hypothetical protein